MSLLPNLEEARQNFTQALEEKYTIKMLVIGNGPVIDEIFQKAQTRAGGFSVRRVIRVAEPGILTVEEQNLYRRNDERVVVCTLNLQGRPIQFLQETESNSYLKLEEAFVFAQQQSER